MANLTPEELALQANTDVLGYIRERNEEAVRTAPANSFIFTAAECAADRYDNVYDYCLAMAQSTYSDCYKEEYGIRPRLDRSLTLSEVDRKICAL